MYIVGFDLLTFSKDFCVYIHEESWSTIFFFLIYLLIFLDTEEGGEREISLLFHLLMRSLGDSRMGLEQGLNPHLWYPGTML